MAKYYAVKKGVVPGVYTTWAECEAMVKGFKDCDHKSFKTLEEAETYVYGKPLNESVEPESKESTNSNMDLNPDIPYAFVDGSFNPNTKVYGYGGFLIENGREHIVQGHDDDEDMASMRNVAGEIKGCQAAIELAINLGLPEINIYYDYMGIEQWATGGWKRNKDGTIAYHDFINSVKDKIKINFIKVKGHSGIDGNERADRLAKDAVGVK